MSNSKKIIKSIQLPAGEYSFCDPCYIMDKTTYDEMVKLPINSDSKMFHPFDNDWDENFMCWKKDADLSKKSECGFLIEKNGAIAAGFFTAIGDGCYGDNKHEFGVDSGLLGVVDKRLQGPCGSRKRGGKSSEFEFSGPGEFNLLDDGSMEIIANGQTLLHIETFNHQKNLLDKWGRTKFLWLADNVSDDVFLETVTEFEEHRDGDKYYDDYSFEDYIVDP